MQPRRSQPRGRWASLSASERNRRGNHIMPNTDNTVKWREASASHPCPSCGRCSWCQVNEYGLVMCRRLAQAGSITRSDRVGVEYHLWRPDERPRRAHFDQPAHTPERADPDTLHLAYTALLTRLSLSEQHRQNL